MDQTRRFTFACPGGFTGMGLSTGLFGSFTSRNGGGTSEGGGVLIPRPCTVRLEVPAGGGLTGLSDGFSGSSMPRYGAVGEGDLGVVGPSAYVVFLRFDFSFALLLMSDGSTSRL